MGRSRQRGSVQRRKIRTRVLARDGHRCVYCGSPDKLTMDHVLPMVRGGGFCFDNLVTACKSCNNLRGGKTWSGPVELRDDFHPNKKAYLLRAAELRATKP